MGFVKEFKEFALRGNVIDMAVGIIIGGAFGKIVTSLVNDVIMPPIGQLLGKVNFSSLKWVLQEGITQNNEVVQPEVAIYYGNFIQTLVDFAIIAFVIFLMIKGINNIRRKKKAEEQAAAPAPSEEVKLLTEIRDMLGRRQA